MRLSKRTEYGLRAIVRLAQLWPQSYVQARDLTQQEDMPSKFLESILLALRRGGFLESKVGSGGGYRLSRDPREISVGDLIRRLEGKITTDDKKPPAPSNERSPGKIAFQLLNEKLDEATNNVLDQMSLGDLVEQVSKASANQNEMYYI